MIIADAHIAGGSGAAAVREICADQHIPTVFVTADPASVEGTLPDAVVLGKPLKPMMFIRALEKVLVTPPSRAAFFPVPPRDGMQTSS